MGKQNATPQRMKEFNEIHTVELSDEQIQIIVVFCDVALKTNGLAYYEAVQKVLNALPKPPSKQDDQETDDNTDEVENADVH